MPQENRNARAIAWDFAAAMDELLAIQASADEWRRWDELRDAAETLVETARTSDGAQLQAWLDEHAVLLIGQQLLVQSVHRDRDAHAEMAKVLRRWRIEAGPHASTRDAIAWLQSEVPALLRAWMLAQLPELVHRELERSRSVADGANDSDDPGSAVPDNDDAGGNDI